MPLALFLWELLTTRVPYSHMQRDADVINEILQGTRPEIRPGDRDDGPEAFLSLVERCWNEEATARPNINEIILMLSRFDAETRFPRETSCDSLKAPFLQSDDNKWALSRKEKGKKLNTVC